MDTNVGIATRNEQSCRRLFLHPELMQPTVLAISVTYIMYVILAKLNLFYQMPSTIQFANYCCLIGLFSAIVHYLRYCQLDASCVNLLHVLALVLLCGLFVTYWSIGTDLSSLQLNSDLTHLNLDAFKGSTGTGGSVSPSLSLQADLLGQLQGPSSLATAPKNCIDKVKCSHPMHLVLHVAMMISVLSALVTRFLPSE